MAFRDRLIATIRAARAALESPGVLVVGSEVPNLLEHGAAATLVVSQDLDIGVPVDRHAALKQRPEPVAQELEPRVILFVPAARVARITSARRLDVRLSAEMLSAECLALVPFETGDRE